jgi:hypothetical protein
MPFITQGKNNWKFLLIVIILVIIVVGFTWWQYVKLNNQPIQLPWINIEKQCKENSDCVDTCCGCIGKEKKCDILCEFLLGRECICVNGKCDVKKDETAECLKKYPVVTFKDCVPGEVVDGWRGIILYPNTLDTSNITHYTDAPAPDIVKQAGVANYGTSRSTCQTTWRIKINEEWKDVNQIDFCNFIIEYNSSCKDCLLEWEEGCC